MEATHQHTPTYEDPSSLLESLLRHEEIRTNALKREARFQVDYPRSNAGWMTTILLVKGRALDNVYIAWIIIMVHAFLYTTLQETLFHFHRLPLQSGEVLFTLVLSSTLAFLLVFRLNRASSRFWEARTLWGFIVARGRIFLGSIIVLGDHNTIERDHAIRWILASILCGMCMLRGDKGQLPDEAYAGLLNQDELQKLYSQGHRLSYAIIRVKKHLNVLFHVDATTPVAVAVLWARHLNILESSVNIILENFSGLERIKSTPLPIAYVSHLRTFLMVSLFLLPYIWGPLWGWSTIPLVAVTAFAWLGIDGAASESEVPFLRERVNALDMGTFCLGLVNVAVQLLKSDGNQCTNQQQQKEENRCIEQSNVNPLFTSVHIT